MFFAFREFHKVNFVRDEMVAWALDEGYEVLMTDADVICYRNPMQNLADNYRFYDYTFQVEDRDAYGEYILKGGLFYVKPTNAAKGAMRILLARLYEVSCTVLCSQRLITHTILHFRFSPN